MNNAKHTPGPWHAYDRWIGFEIHDADHTPINDEFRETFSERTRLVRQKPHIPDSHTLRVAINVLKRQGCSEALIAAMEDLRTRIEKREKGA